MSNIAYFQKGGEILEAVEGDTLFQILSKSGAIRVNEDGSLFGEPAPSKPKTELKKPGKPAKPVTDKEAKIDVAGKNAKTNAKVTGEPATFVAETPESTTYVTAVEGEGSEIVTTTEEVPVK